MKGQVRGEAAEKSRRGSEILGTEAEPAIADATNAPFVVFSDLIANTARIGLWSYDTRTGALVRNEQWDRLLGYGPGELPDGTPAWEVAILEADAEKVCGQFERFLDSKAETFESVYRMRRKDGAVIWVQDKGAVAEDEGGKPVHVVGIKQDVTDRKTAEIALSVARGKNESYRGLLRRDIEYSMGEILKQDRLLKAVYIAASILMSSGAEDFDEAMRESLKIIASSVGADRMFVRRNEERDGKAYSVLAFGWFSEGTLRERERRFLSEVDYDDAPEIWRKKLPAGITENFNVRDLPEPDRAFLTEVGIKSILMIPVFIDNGYWGFLCVDDCREERLFSDREKAILNSAALLIVSAIHRNDVTENLIRAREEAASSERAKGVFLASMSHEIRTPLNAIIGMSAIAQGSPDDPVKVADCLGKIDSASRHLLRLVNDVLDMSKIGARKLELKRQDYSFNGMLKDIYNINVVKASDKGTSLVFDVAPDVPDALKGDELRLSQVINNILSNAVKFTPRDGAVRLSVRLASDRGGDGPAIEVAVEDNGIGISGENIKKLFNPFVQADASVSGKYGGTGLGLAISKNIVEQMGGRIGVTSEAGRGSRFFFQIPVEPGFLSQEAQSGGPSEYDFSGKRLLVAEDIDINRDIVKGLLDGTGAEIDFARDGREAVDMFTSSPDRYDMIYMDLRMPELDGYEATAEIRGSGLGRSRDVPIVAMTANAFAEDAEKCVSAGMNDHMAKPVDVKILLEMTAKYLCHKG